MRYYLAIDACLGALATPAPERFEESLERWFTEYAAANRRRPLAAVSFGSRPRPLNAGTNP
jgi:hypothetical protein